jgi:hypothetical protein
VPAGRSRAAESGVAVLLVLVFLSLFLSVAAALVVTTTMETRMAGAEQARQVARGAAEVVLERALQELAIAADWNAILAGASASAFVDGMGSRQAADWGALDLVTLTDRLQQETDASNQWGSDAQTWRLFAHGPLDALLPSASGGRLATGGGGHRETGFYVVAWVADDNGEGDGNPGADTNGRMAVRAEAFGPFRSRQAALATVRRHGASLELLSWQVSGGA